MPGKPVLKGLFYNSNHNLCNRSHRMDKKPLMTEVAMQGFPPIQSAKCG